MNGLFVNCALAASTVAASALFMERRLKKVNEMIAHEESVEEAVDKNMTRLQEYAQAAQAGSIDAEKAAALAKESASDANTSAHEARETSTATIGRVRDLLNEQEARFNALEAKLQQNLATRAGDLDRRPS